MEKIRKLPLDFLVTLDKFEIPLEKRLIIVANNDVVIISVQRIMEQLTSIRKKYVKMVNTAFSKFKTQSEAIQFLERMAKQMVMIKV